MRRRSRADFHTSTGLFLRLFPQSAQPENTLTEMFAGVLQADARAADASWRHVTAQLAPRVQSASGAIRVETQVTMSTGEIIDLVVRRGPYRLGVEHKLDSPLGPAQLERHLRLPRADLTHVALVSHARQAIPATVLTTRRYARPIHGEYFRWKAFEGLLVASAARGYPDAARLHALFADRGLGASHHLLPTFGPYDSDEWRRYDRTMRRHLHAWVHAMERVGWDDVRSSIRFNRTSEMFADVGPSPLLPEVRLNALESGAALVVVLKTTSASKRAELLRNLAESHVLTRWPGAHAERGRAVRPTVRALDWHVRLRLPWDAVLYRLRGRQEIGTRLADVLLMVIAAAGPTAIASSRCHGRERTAKVQASGSG